jgi:outer membrane immunogenic protein
LFLTAPLIFALHFGAEIHGEVIMMRTLILALTSAALLTGTAHAADLGWIGSTSPVNSMYSGTSVFQWQGFYAGVNAGYGFGTLSQQPAGGGPVSDHDTGGWDIGGQVGYNVDMGGFVLGAEADLQWAPITYEQDLGAAGNLKAGLDGFGTVRGRAGLTFDRVMPYITGGVAYGRGTVSLTDDVTNVVTSQSNTHLGWTIGAGLEAAATDNITLKAEYLYVDLGTQAYAPGGGADVSQRFSVIRAGINYKF